jgi:hypothetical protein
MTRHTARDWTVEEFDGWQVASDRIEAVARAADEAGGPSLSLVPATGRGEVWPTDLLPPAAAEASSEPSPESSSTGDSAAEAPTEPSAAAMPFDGIALDDSRKRLAGWSAERQRLFLVNLAETGSVHLASAAARLTARSAYRLRARSPAFDRAINGRTEQVWREGTLVAEKRLPSDRLLMWLLARLDPRRFAAPWELRKDGAADPQGQARESFPALLDALPDIASP